ncbi:MAG: hypothetical protein K940chlam9_01771 [Chlamydiae bacterium]|nr:hypothetical protein [Chlamydiota bacterium]
MKRTLFFCVCLSLCLASCNRTYRDSALYQQSGRPKPIVTLLPTLDHSSDTSLAWDLSKEFTEEFRKKMYDSSKVYLLRDGADHAVAEKLNPPNPEAIPSEVIADLGATEFAVVTEIFEHKQTPHPTSVGSATLELGMRVRVIDVRNSTPKVVLQEIYQQEQLIAPAYIQMDYQRNGWQSETFQNTPVGMLHNRMIREIAGRIEAYIEATR